jgi:hypothetical protein
VLAFALFGCDVTAVELAPDTSAVNECSGDGECSGGICRAGRCVALQGAFSTVLLDITVPPSASGDFAGVEYLQRLDQLALGGENREIMLAPVAHVSGAVHIDPYQVGATTSDLCQLAFQADDPTLTVSADVDGNIPVDVSFTPSDRILGLATSTYASTVSTAGLEGVDPAPALSFAINVPPGDYDIYLQPRAPAAGGCNIPPHLLRRVAVQQGNVSLDLELPTPASFALTIQWPVSTNQKSLDGWAVDMLDPLSGRVISTRAVLGNPLSKGSLSEYQTTISYAPVELESSMSELVRLSPPASLDAPTIVLARSVLELFSKGTGILNQFEDYPDAVDVEGQVTLAGSTTPMGATVTLVASNIDGVGDGVFASYRRTVSADSDGNFNVKLLPGSYHVYAVPTSAGTMADSDTGNRVAAATQTEWQVAASPAMQAGKVVELLPVTHLVGTATTPAGRQVAAGATVAAVASPSEVQVDLLTSAAQGDFAFAPTAQSSPVNSKGEFDVEADPGTFDISVRPPEDSGFSWFVSRVTVLAAVTPEPQKLGSILLPLPVPYTGRLSVRATQSGTATGAAVSEALIRAYVYLDADAKNIDDPTKAASVVQIGETRADANGDFELLIPANLN